MKRNLFVLVVSALLLFPFKISAQDTLRTVSGDFNKLTFGQFIKEVESQTGYRFYYEPSDLDSIIVDVSVSKVSLPEVLAKALDTSRYHVAIDHRKMVFVSRTRKIRTDLPAGLFTSEVVVADTVEAGHVGENVPEEQAMPKKNLIGSAEHRVIVIGKKTANLGGMVILSGVVKDAERGKGIDGAFISVAGRTGNAISDKDGNYSISLPRGNNTIIIRRLGMQPTNRKLMIYEDGTVDIFMEYHVETDEVVVTGNRDVVEGMEMGQDYLSIKAIRQTPTIFGEADVLRVIMTLPGVQTSGEASTGFNVRGGAADQNLILFNDAVVYNPSHLFGFFSAFNPDVIKSVELYKSNIPAQHGGRLSSVLEIVTRDGNSKKFAGSGGIGLLTGRLTLEGPIIKGKTSFIIGGRSTYSNWLLNQLKNSVYSGSSASFHDVNLHLSHRANEKNHFSLTAYHSSDNFNLKKEVMYGYRNQNMVLKWRREFGSKLTGTFTGAYSGYNYDVANESNPVNGYKLQFGIRQYQFKSDFKYRLNDSHTLAFGLSSLHYAVQPGKTDPSGPASKVISDAVQEEQGLESALYISDLYEVSPRLSFQGGIRFSFFNYLGPKDVYLYPEGIPKSVYTVRDTVTYKKGEAGKSYGGPEFRLSGRYMLTDNMSVKLSYNTTRQYIHMLSNTTSISPTDIWKLSDPNIEPTKGQQVSLGFYRNYKSGIIETSVEIYGKRMTNYLDYKPGARLIQNHHVETDVVSTRGKGYGAEFMVKKTSGKLNGWVSYTYSRILLNMDDAAQGEPINNGSWYPANFDKPHDFTFIGNYRLSYRFSTSLNLTYSTGRPVTLPVAHYNLAGSQRVLFSDRNQYRIPNYFRIDLSLNIEGNHKIKKLAHSSWTVAIYNLTGRRNVYSVYFRSENGKIQGYKLSVFGQPIPTITYNFRF